jgi:hypothetical protein
VVVELIGRREKERHEKASLWARTSAIHRMDLRLAPAASSLRSADDLECPCAAAQDHSFGSAPAASDHPRTYFFLTRFNIRFLFCRSITLTSTFQSSFQFSLIFNDKTF